MKWRGVRGLSVALALALGGCGNAGLPGASAPTVVPAAAVAGWQQIPLADLDSRPVTLAKVLAGRPALVNLWAPWCERCKTELPDLDRLARQLDGCGVIVGVAVGEDAPHTAAFVRERGLVYPQVVDEGFHLADALRQSRVPTTLVDRRRRSDHPRRAGARSGGGRRARVSARPRGRRGALQRDRRRCRLDLTNHEPSWVGPRDFVATTRLMH